MRYPGVAVFVVCFFMAVSPLWAATEATSGFFALSDLDNVQNEGAGLKQLSDAQLSTVEGSSRLSRWNNDGGRGRALEQMVMFMVLRLLNDFLHGGGSNTLSSQNNFLVQLNIAIGNNITQTNNAVQYNMSTAMQQAR